MSRCQIIDFTLFINSTALSHIFCHLNSQELTKVSRVCRVWKNVAYDSLRNREILLKGVRVLSLKSFSEWLIAINPRMLNLKDVSFVSVEDGANSAVLLNAVKELDGLRKLEMPFGCKGKNLEKILQKNLKIESIVACGLKENLVLSSSFALMKNCNKLTLEASKFIQLNGSLSQLGEMRNLAQLVSK